MFLTINVKDSQYFSAKVDVFIVDVLELNVLELVNLGQPTLKQLLLYTS